jgi:hypothetical protein
MSNTRKRVEEMSIIETAIDTIIGRQPFDYDRLTQSEIDAIRILINARKYIVRCGQARYF